MDGLKDIVKVHRKKELQEPPKWVQSGVKAIYLTGFSVILTFLLTLIEYILLGSSDSGRMFGYYMISQILVSFAFINKNITIDKVMW